MVYRRKGRPTLYFDGLIQGGRFKSLSTGTARRSLAVAIAGMWDALARDHRAWDLLNRVVAGDLPIGHLFDLWTQTRCTVPEVRRLLADVDLGPLVSEWHTWHASRVAIDSAAHALVHVRALIPEDTHYLRSRATTAALTKALAAYPGGSSTRRKVHSSWSGFFEYATGVHQHFPRNPMADVLRPALRKLPIQFYELDEVERIIEWQPAGARKVIMALLYGSAVEVSIACGLLRLHVLEPEKSVKAAGTKALTRNRVARVDDWAWPMLAVYIRGLLPTAPLFPGFTRWTVSDWHREAVKALKLPAYPLKNARHSWAVRNLRAGVPIHVVQSQLGHGTAKLTLDTYGTFMPSGVDRDEAAKLVTDHEARRRAVSGGIPAASPANANPNDLSHSRGGT